jgi:hypothetical protein
LLQTLLEARAEIREFFCWFLVELNDIKKSSEITELQMIIGLLYRTKSGKR